MIDTDNILRHGCCVFPRKYVLKLTLNVRADSYDLRQPCNTSLNTITNKITLDSLVAIATVDETMNYYVA